MRKVFDRQRGAAAAGAPVRAGPPGPRRYHRLAVALAACGVIADHKAYVFALAGAKGPAGPGSGSGGTRHGRTGMRLGTEKLVEMPVDGIASFQGSEQSLWLAFFMFLTALPGTISLVQRTGQAKLIEKTYMLPGQGVGGLEMRSIAGGIVAYFRTLNYQVKDAPNGRIRFVGNMQGSVSQALYISGCVLGAFLGIGFVIQGFLPTGPFGLGVNWDYLPCLLSPLAGWYYWGRSFRRDIVELQLSTDDDSRVMTLSALGDRETIESLQRGVRFQSVEGRWFQLMEQGMEYQPGIFENMPLVAWKAKELANKKKAAKIVLDPAEPVQAERVQETA